jgi:triphosphoribosyl-dephospho-CoA synthase
MTCADPGLLATARAAFVRACRLDVETDKPGNVSVASAGHGMTASLFIASAEAAAEPLFAPRERVGARILEAVRRTREVAGCNTNLGIVLLAAPLAAALDDLPAPISASAWHAATQRVLARLDLEDARLAYEAIALANPGGLGDAPEQSVHDAPTVGLSEAMALAAGRDSIARQYANGFADVFGTGLAAVNALPAAAPGDVTLDVFLSFLAGWPDSHIVRKAGVTVAQSVTGEAAERRRQWRAASSAVSGGQAAQALARAALAAWDAELKARGINPGTSADLTVATLFVAAATGALRG